MTLADLEQQRAALPDDGDLPASTTRGELDAHRQRRADLDRRISLARSATHDLARLGTDEADERWRADLIAWRAVLSDERKSFKSPVRDPKLLGLQRNVTLSLKVIDFGTGHLDGTGYELTNLRLGELMRASGYAVVGADPASNFVGWLPWHGSVPEVDKRIADGARRRAAVQARLDVALMDDAMVTTSG